MFADLHLLRPYWLIALIPAVGLWWVLWRRQDSMGALRKVFDSHLLEHLRVGEKKRSRVRPIHVLLIVWLLSVVALSGPSWRTEPSPFADDQAGLLVLLKVSGSMEATDVQPARLERAKHKLRDLLELREGASTGLIVYSGTAHLVMPLTRDDRIISVMAEDLTPEVMPKEGDAVAEALELASSVFERAEVPGSVLIVADSVSPSQVQEIAAREQELPVQFLAVQGIGASMDSGINEAARVLDAPVTRLAVEETDVERVAGRAEREFAAAASDQVRERRRDSGYAVLPLIVLGALLWSRKGWVVR